MMDTEIRPITMPGIHERFHVFFRKYAAEFGKPKILEIGAGHGAFTERLYRDGYEVSACDLFPELFYLKEVECRKADLTGKLPYDPDSFDIIVAVEVMEHIHDHQNIFLESSRILKKNGLFLFSTPNILSLKSRFRFLFSGFFYAFKPIDHKTNDGLQHISSLTADQYVNLGLNNGFRDYEFSIDKQQSTSRIYLFMLPFLWAYCRLKKIDYRIHNQYKFLTGRILFGCFRK
jgi:SAM-dependent methyltransferase